MNFSEINHELVLFIVFNLILILMMSIDLGLFSKNTHEPMSLKKAAKRTAIWVFISLTFALFIYLYDTDPLDPTRHVRKTMEYLAGYLLEYSLSIDNLFVFIMIFQKFKVSKEDQPEILKWGIIGALVLRAIMILVGAALISKFASILYVFGAFLIYTAFKMFFSKEEEEDFVPEKNLVFRIMKRIIPIGVRDPEGKFFHIENGRRIATTLFMVLVLIEASDVMFALDSIPAVFSVTQDPFIVYTSNIFAILGLRSLFFMISGIMGLFIYLKQGVAIILAFVGVKMLLPLYGVLTNTTPLHVPIQISLAVIVLLLFGSVLVSLPSYYANKREEKNEK